MIKRVDKMTHIGLIVLGFSIIFLATTIGGAIVWLFKKEISEKTNTLFLGFASGIMIASSIWSLIIPALEESSYLGILSFIPALGGFLLGGLFLVLIDFIFPKLRNESSGVDECHSLTKIKKLFIVVTIHNIPEGLAVGFAFGAASFINQDAYYYSALILAIGIAIQNIPEGAAVALPIKSATGSSSKAFFYSMISGIVEPLFAVVGFFLASFLTLLQPWFLSFAAGAMIFVVAEELIPDAHLESHPHLGTWGVMLGFAIMMVLDVALG